MHKFIRMFQAFSILKDLSQGEKITKEGWSTTTKNYPGLKGGEIPCKYFIPGRKVKSRLIIFPGASPFGEDHPALNVLGAALARSGVEVVVPRIPLLMDLALTKDIIPSMCHFYSWYISQKDDAPVKVAGVSYGGAMVLKCLLEKEFMAAPPQSVLVYGTHVDLREALDHYFLPEPRELTSEWPMIVFFHNFLNRIDPGYDTTGLNEFLSRRVRDDEALDLLSSLQGPEKELAQALADGQMTDEIRRLAPMILNSCQPELEFFSPSNWAEGINNMIHILHGSQDVMVHWTQSQGLAAVLKNNRLLITHLFEHRDMVSGGSRIKKAVELFKLVSFVQSYLNN